MRRRPGEPRRAPRWRHVHHPADQQPPLRVRGGRAQKTTYRPGRRPSVHRCGRRIHITGGYAMGSNAKKKTTMAKLTRESTVRERRLEKQAKKDAKKQA